METISKPTCDLPLAPLNILRTMKSKVVMPPPRNFGHIGEKSIFNYFRHIKNGKVEKAMSVLVIFFDIAR